MYGGIAVSNYTCSFDEISTYGEFYSQLTVLNGGNNASDNFCSVNAMGGMMGGMQQPNTPSGYNPFGQPAQQPTQPAPQAAPTQEDPTTKLLEMKKLLDAGAISQEEYDLLKAKILGV